MNGLSQLDSLNLLSVALSDSVIVGSVSGMGPSDSPKGHT